VEAHAVMPTEEDIERWIKGTLAILDAIRCVGPYVQALKKIDDRNEPKYKEYISLEVPASADADKKSEYDQIVGEQQYRDFFDRAVELAVIYVKAAYKIYMANALDDTSRANFRKVVRNADMSSSLEDNILETARNAFASLA
jgi:hypothetical protein